MTPAQLTLALRGHWHGSYGSAACPGPTHGKGRGDRSRNGLTIREGKNGRPLVWCQALCPSDSIIGELKARGLWDGENTPSPSGSHQRTTPSQPDGDAIKKSEAARAIWRETQDPHRTPVEVYLRARLIDLQAIGEIPRTIRYHPTSAWHDRSDDACHGVRYSGA